MNKYLKKPKFFEKLVKYKKALGLGALVLTSTIAINSKLTDDPITLGIVSDRSDDNFENGVPLYTDPEASKLITVLPDGCLIISTEKIGEETPEILKVAAINEQDVKVRGYVPFKYVQNHITIDSDTTLYKVKTGQGVNLRETPEIASDNKIGAIPNNALVIGNQKNKEWSHVTYITKHSMNSGYVANNFIREFDSLSNEKAETAKNHIQVNYTVENGNVFGIDVNDIPPELLEDLLTGKFKIPKNIKTNIYPNVDLSRFKNRKPDFVYIKLLGSTYRSENITKGKPTPYKELSAICERLKVPYGFYYYSTSINDEEAKQEHQWISEAMKDLGPRSYNLLPFVLDVEIFDDKDRQFRAKTAEVTNAKISLANLLEPDYGKTMLYTARNACNTILDINQYHNGLNSGNSGMWFVSPENSIKHMKALNEIKQHVFARQIVLDGSLDYKVSRNRPKPLIDINIFNSEKFKECIEGKYQNLSLAYASKNSSRAVATIENER